MKKNAGFDTKSQRVSFALNATILMQGIKIRCFALAACIFLWQPVHATIISTNTVLSANTSFPDAVSILNGATLTITSGATVTTSFTVSVEPGGKLIVQNNSTLKVGSFIYVKDGNNPSISEPGAEMYISSGATITAMPSSFSNSWQGIEVWGAPEDYNSAKLYAEQGSVKRAQCAIKNYHYNA